MLFRSMVDREAKRAEGKGVGYDRWAAKHNLKQMAATATLTIYTTYYTLTFYTHEELLKEFRTLSKDRVFFYTRSVFLYIGYGILLALL